LATNPERAFKPRRRLLGRRNFSGRLQHLSHQAIGALPLALKTSPMTGCCRLRPRDHRLQRHDPCRQGVARPATAWSLWGMPYFSEINAHHRLAIIRK
jgi:hypothetical protein